MKKLSFFVAAALSAMTLLTSCLGESKNVQSFSIGGVYYFDGIKPMIDAGSAQIYIPELLSTGDYKDGSCLGLGIQVDYTSEENANRGTNGYLTASLTGQPVVIDNWTSSPIISATDTTTLKENEITLNAGYVSGSYNNYARGYMIFTSYAKIGSKQNVNWYLQYPQDLKTIEKDGKKMYQLYVRATAEGDDTGASNQYVDNAFYAKGFMDRINAMEADNKDGFTYLNFNFVRAIDEDTKKPVWGSTVVMMPISQEQK